MGAFTRKRRCVEICIPPCKWRTKFYGVCDRHVTLKVISLLHSLLYPTAPLPRSTPLLFYYALPTTPRPLYRTTTPPLSTPLPRFTHCPTCPALTPTLRHYPTITPPLASPHYLTLTPLALWPALTPHYPAVPHYPDQPTHPTSSRVTTSVRVLNLASPFEHY